MLSEALDNLLRPYLDWLNIAHPKAKMDGPDAIIVLRSRKGSLVGKWVLSGAGKDGGPGKSAPKVIIDDVGRQVAVPNADALSRLLKAIGDDRAAKIIVGRLKHPPKGETPQASAAFRQLSRKTFMEETDAAPDRGWAPDASGMPCITKTGEHAALSSWVMFDLDVSDSTPEEMRDLTPERWIEIMEDVCAGFVVADVVATRSASSRVVWKESGLPMLPGKGGQHFYVRVKDPEDVAAFAVRAMGWAIGKGYGWREVSDKTGFPVSLTIFDVSPLGDALRWSYEGRPGNCGMGRVLPPEVKVFDGEGKDRRLDTRSLGRPEGVEIVQRLVSSGLEVLVEERGRGGSRAWFEDRKTMTPDYVVQTERGGIEAEALWIMLTLESDGWREARERKPVRAQGFRSDAQNWAGLVRIGPDGRLMAHDMKTRITYRPAWPGPSPKVWQDIIRDLGGGDPEKLCRAVLACARSLAWHRVGPATRHAAVGWLVRRLGGDPQAARASIMQEIEYAQRRARTLRDEEAEEEQDSDEGI